MQEEVDQKTIALAVSATKMTGRVFAKAVQAYLNHKKGKGVKVYHGKQSLKKLQGENVQLSSMELSDKNIRGFEPIAKKYRIAYSLHKDKTKEPPVFYVFFKAKDADVIDMALKEFAAKRVAQKKPSVRRALGKIQQRNRQREKNRSKERGMEL